MQIRFFKLNPIIFDNMVKIFGGSNIKSINKNDNKIGNIERDG